MGGCGGDVPARQARRALKFSSARAGVASPIPPVIRDLSKLYDEIGFVSQKLLRPTRAAKMFVFPRSAQRRSPPSAEPDKTPSQSPLARKPLRRSDFMAQLESTSRIASSLFPSFASVPR